MPSNHSLFLVQPSGDLQLQGGGETLYRTILESLHDGVFFLDPELRVVACNSSVERILGLSRSQLIGVASIDPKTFGAIDETGLPIPEEAHPSRVTLRTGTPCVGVVQGIRNARGELTWINVNAQPIRGTDGEVEGVVVSISDITATKRLETRLRQEAHFDDLTGLANRRYFHGELLRAVNAARRHGHAMSLCICDLDRFKGINDTFGHIAGDRALQTFSEAILLELRQDELAARLGGDEFCILFAHSPVPDAMASLERIRENLATLEVALEGGGSFHISASFGLTEYDRTMDHELFFDTADRALYKAKSGGRNRVEVL